MEVYKHIVDSFGVNLIRAKQRLFCLVFCVLFQKIALAGLYLANTQNFKYFGMAVFFPHPISIYLLLFSYNIILMQNRSSCCQNIGFRLGNNLIGQIERNFVLWFFVNKKQKLQKRCFLIMAILFRIVNVVASADDFYLTIC